MDTGTIQHLIFLFDSTRKHNDSNNLIIKEKKN